MTTDDTPQKKAYDPATEDWTDIEEFRNNEFGMSAAEMRIAFGMPLIPGEPLPPCLVAEAAAGRARSKAEQS